MAMSNLQALFKGLEMLDQGTTQLATSIAANKAAKEAKALNDRFEQETNQLQQQLQSGALEPSAYESQLQKIQDSQLEAQSQLGTQATANFLQAGASAADAQAMASRLGLAPNQLANQRLQRQQMDRADERLDKQLSAQQKIAQTKARAQTVKPSKFAEERTKTFAKQIDRDMKSNEALVTQLDRAEKLFASYIKQGGNTGAGTDIFGARTAFSTARQGVSRAFDTIALDTLIKKFAGFSRSIDTDSERAFFNATQLSVSENRPETNARIMMGMKSLAARERIEMEAKREYIQNNGVLDSGYVSPLIGKEPVVNPDDGSVRFVDKNNVPVDAVSLDDYASALGTGRTTQLRFSVKAENDVVNIAAQKVGADLNQLSDQQKKEIMNMRRGAQ